MRMALCLLILCSSTFLYCTQKKGKWASIPSAIYFYKKSDPYYEFTNFYPRSVTIDKKIWPTTEHYFQAKKFPGSPKLQEKIRKLPTARDAFNEGRNSKNQKFKDPKWGTNKFAVMTKAVRAKFAQHQDLKKLLLETDGKILVEDAGANDAIWGAGADYNGGNHLGRILMHIRDELSCIIPKDTPYDPLA